MDGKSGFDEGPGEVNMVARVLYGIAVAELEMPHIVLTRSTDTGETTYSGPYPTGLEALAAAEAEWQVDREAGGRGDISFHVAAVYPPLEVTPANDGPDSPLGEEPTDSLDDRFDHALSRGLTDGVDLTQHTPPVARRHLLARVTRALSARWSPPCHHCSCGTSAGGR